MKAVVIKSCHVHHNKSIYKLGDVIDDISEIDLNHLLYHGVVKKIDETNIGDVVETTLTTEVKRRKK